MATESQSLRARRARRSTQRSQSGAHDSTAGPRGGPICAVAPTLCGSVTPWQKHSAISAISALILAIAVVTSGCRRDMQDQPKYIPLRASSFFPDDRSARPLFQGTVARGHLDDDTLLETGKIGNDDSTVFPFAVDAR